MAWSISHTQEAWDNAQKNLHKWSQIDLIKGIASSEVDLAIEQAEQRTEALEKSLNPIDDLFSLELSFDYADLMAHYEDQLSDVPKRLLVEKALELIAHWQTCDNGGGAFWLDKEGYYRVKID